MIQIHDEQFQKKVRGGRMTLDRAAVITVAVSVREDLEATPMIRCDVAFGTEENGEFEPWDYNNPVTTIPIFIEGSARFAECISGAHHCGPVECGCDLIGELIAWLEVRLMAEGRFGMGAVIDFAQNKPRALRLDGTDTGVTMRYKAEEVME